MRFEEALVEARKGRLIKRRNAGRFYRTFKDGELCEIIRIDDGAIYSTRSGYPISLQAISANDWFAIDYNEDLIQ
jgi:hypothetical protein